MLEEGELSFGYTIVTGPLLVEGTAPVHVLVPLLGGTQGTTEIGVGGGEGPVHDPTPPGTEGEKDTSGGVPEKSGPGQFSTVFVLITVPT